MEDENKTIRSEISELKEAVTSPGSEDRQNSRKNWKRHQRCKGANVKTH